MSSAPVLAVDGPGGAGKGTLCRVVAERLGWHLLDSGALYRLVAAAAARAGTGLDDEAGLAGLARDLPVRFAGGKVWLGDEDVSEEIRTEDCGNRASRVAALPGVRTALVGLQREFRRPPGLVADGRDMGTVIFPDAELKVFLTASAEERARRRYKQLKEKGFDVNLAGLSAEVAARDRRDAERAVAPLRPAPDAVVVDSTTLDIDEVVACVLEEMARRGLASRP
ncbi:(d)CMP kinase [Thioalkalivibrio sp. XN279]|uniref:(d)CMP kinase n=1 Tax=Thioalkalivibrio sp. XN279 TaxID=2714953 RepID=UPI00140BA9C2|nr:(d)CMP kinase [Thioalkalivibrio sp. XN279]NHA14516.1 (d)CMP kinase [Thioalkalivibrio sp. XN279]